MGRSEKLGPTAALPGAQDVAGSRLGSITLSQLGHARRGLGFNYVHTCFPPRMAVHTCFPSSIAVQLDPDTKVMTPQSSRRGLLQHAVPGSRGQQDTTDNRF